MNEKIVDWTDVKKWIEDNWFETQVEVLDNEIDQMAIGVAGEIDKFIISIRNKENKNLKVCCNENCIMYCRESAQKFIQEFKHCPECGGILCYETTAKKRIK